jgi:tetratricopeptide (TPR) repeat protein
MVLRRGLGVAIGLALLAASGGLGLGLWWRGRPERHLAEAEQALDAGIPGAAAPWLDLPEATPATRDRALVLRARAALALGRPAEAVGPLEQVDPRGPSAACAAFWKGRTLLAAGQTARAISWFRRGLNLRPDDAEALRWLAVAAYDLGARDDAVAALGAVTRLRPDDARAWRTLALIFKENEEYRRAVPCYERSLAHDPGQPRVRLELAEALVALGRHAEAERQLASCRGLVSEADRVVLLAQCLAARGDRTRSREVLDAALAEAPGHPGLLGRRAELDRAEGRLAEALARLDRALAGDPYNPAWLYHKGLVLGRLGRDAEAAAALARAAELNATLAELSELDQEASRHPEDPEVRYQLGRRCVLLGKPELAASWYRAALACDPRHAAARLGLVALRAR